MGPTLRLRAATGADAATICRIYNQGIQDRVATLETEERTPEERAAWLEARGPRHPVLIAESGGEVVGWASLNVFNARRAYEHVADLSLYVERGWRGRGVGRRLLEALIGRAGELGYHKLVLAAFPWNAAGMRAYARAGFREVGIYREQGRLDGRWVDTIIMEKLLEGPNAH
ncbi:MAG TPA: arsinothricin resistance N-acetyltransferase ArsN1 family A [Methylomirabilota bacterium]|jgi:phosphinothricin acetyltransferase